MLHYRVPKFGGRAAGPDLCARARRPGAPTGSVYHGRAIHHAARLSARRQSATIPARFRLAMIELLNVSKRYGTKVAVENLNLHIQPGEMFAFLGPNGAGKTTTIKMICGLLFPTSGKIRVGGYDLVRQGDQARLLISYLPDVPYLYEKLTGREFLEFIADMYGLDRQFASRKMGEVIALFELEDFVDDLTERYSHGMRQRTVFASALLHNPKVLIVDEPTVGLDPASVRKLKNILLDQVRSGTTVFLSTHSL